MSFPKRERLFLRLLKRKSSINDVAKALKILDEHITRTKNSAAIHFPI
jgi:hypothetical protein